MASKSPPIRFSINPFEDDNTGYDVGDTIRVELLSVTEVTYLYLNEILTQTDRAGGISELFSVPVTNLNSNIEVTAGSETTLGLFCTSSASIRELILTEERAEEAKANAN